MKRAKYISNGTITYKITGDQGPQGPEGPKGDTGKSAYQIAVDNGYNGTESEWLATLNGDDFNVEIAYLNNGYINKSDGKVINYDGWKYTDFIDVGNAISLRLNYQYEGSKQSQYNAMYDENKNIITSFDCSVTKLTLRENTKYVRFSFPNSNSISVNKVFEPKCDRTDVEKLLKEKNNIIDVPSYYSTMVSNNISLINNYMDDNNVEAFVFLSDMHINENSLSSSAIIRNIIDNTSINTIINGGDTISSWIDENKAMKDIENYNKYYGFAKPYYCRGNHDIWGMLSSDATDGYIAPNTKVFNRFFKWFENDVNIEDGKMYYYFDKKSTNTRYIVLDNNELMTATHTDSGAYNQSCIMSQNQIDWFGNVLSTTPRNYKIVVITHSPIYNLMWYYHEPSLIVSDIIEAYNAKTTINKTSKFGLIANFDFSDANASVVLSCCGHGHREELFVSGTGCVYYEISCDAMINNGHNDYNKIKGTSSESTVDVILINNTTNKIKRIRFGGGNVQTDMN